MLRFMYWLRSALRCFRQPPPVAELTGEEMQAVREVWSRAKQREIGQHILRVLIERKPQFKDYFGIHVSDENMDELYSCKEFQLQNGLLCPPDNNCLKIAASHPSGRGKIRTLQYPNAHRIQNFLDTAVSSIGFCPMSIVHQMAHRVGQIHYYRGVNFGADNWLTFKKVTVEIVTSDLRDSISDSKYLLLLEVNPEARLAKIGWEKFMGSVVREMKRGFLEEARRNCGTEEQAL